MEGGRGQGGGSWRGASREELERAERRAARRGGVSPPPEMVEVDGVRRGFKADVLEQYRAEAAGAFSRKQWAKAEFYLRQMLAIMAHVRGETLDVDSGEAVDHVDLAPVLYRMGQVPSHMRRFPKEERYLRRALRSLEEAEGPDDRCAASMMRYRVLVEIVECLMRKEKAPCAEAARLGFRALCLCERMYGSTNLRVSEDLVRLVRCHALVAQYPEAEMFLRRAHNIERAASGTQRQGAFSASCRRCSSAWGSSTELPGTRGSSGCPRARSGSIRPWRPTGRPLRPSTRASPSSWALSRTTPSGAPRKAEEERPGGKGRAGRMAPSR